MYQQLNNLLHALDDFELQLAKEDYSIIDYTQLNVILTKIWFRILGLIGILQNFAGDFNHEDKVDQKFQKD